MKYKAIGIIAFFIILSILAVCSQQDDMLDLQGPYLGQTPPGMTAELFNPEGLFIDGQGQGCSGFLCGGTVFVFTSMKPGGDWRFRPTYVTYLKNSRWTKPEIAPFSEYGPYNFTVGPDDETIYFTTMKSPNKSTSMWMEQANIWVLKLLMNGWTEPVMLGRSINTEKYYENYPAVTREGTIYYMSRREEGIGGTDVWLSRNIDGKYAKAENVGKPVNTENRDIDPFVAPDESYLIVCQELGDSIGKLDLYIYFRKSDGSWTRAINMGEGVNSASFEARPYVTPDGKYLFFTSNRSEKGRIWWVDASVIETLRAQNLK